MSISIWSNARLYSWMKDKLSKGGNYKRFKKGSKPEYSNSGPENFVHPRPLFKISGSAPGMKANISHKIQHMLNFSDFLFVKQELICMRYETNQWCENETWTGGTIRTFFFFGPCLTRSLFYEVRISLCPNWIRSKSPKVRIDHSWRPK